MIQSREVVMLRLFFGTLAGVAVFLVGWLGYVQVGQRGELARSGRAPLRLVPATADSQGQRSERVPAPRGTIVDRRGSLLAVDCESYELSLIHI